MFSKLNFISQSNVFVMTISKYSLLRQCPLPLSHPRCSSQCNAYQLQFPSARAPATASSAAGSAIAPKSTSNSMIPNFYSASLCRKNNVSHLKKQRGPAAAAALAISMNHPAPIVSESVSTSASSAPSRPSVHASRGASAVSSGASTNHVAAEHDDKVTQVTSVAISTSSMLEPHAGNSASIASIVQHLSAPMSSSSASSSCTSSSSNSTITAGLLALSRAAGSVSLQNRVAPGAGESTSPASASVALPFAPRTDRSIAIIAPLLPQTTQSALESAMDVLSRSNAATVSSASANSSGALVLFRPRVALRMLISHQYGPFRKYLRDFPLVRLIPSFCGALV